MPPELWTLGVSLPRVAVRTAERAEADGWDGLLLVDSQNLSGDTYIELALAAKATSRLKLGTGVTNPYTRHPAVTASAIATVQAESNGRAVLGIGRGDSSLAHLGLAPAPVPAFARYLERLQAYLRGEEVTFERPVGVDAPPPVDSLGLARVPSSSRPEWLRSSQAKVPLDVAATGPRVIATGARIAERVTFAVGADPDRLAWALHAAREAAGGRTISFGAYVNVVPHPDVAVARSLASGSLATFARFSAMHGAPAGPLRDRDRDVLTAVHDAYDMTRHTMAGSDQTSALDDEFVDRFGVVGPVHHCVRKLQDLVALGLERLVIIGGSAGADRAAVGEASVRLVREVLPALRG